MSEIVYPALRVSPEEYEKYRGRHVALYKGKIIGEGSNSVEALKARYGSQACSVCSAS